GVGAKTDANQNVYHSLQLTTGHYKLSFHADGEAGKTVGVKLVRYGNASVVFNKTVTVGKDVTLFFDIENDAFGQYKITFTRQSASDNISISNIVLTTTEESSISLDTNTDNTEILDAHANDKVNVTINGRKLHKDGYWNSLCLPFDVTVSESVLDGATVKTLESTSFSEGTLTLNFSESNLSKIEAGKPYIIMWGSGDDIEDPVFEGVTIKNSTTTVETSCVNFKGSFAPAVYEEATNKVLYLSENNTLYYPSEAMTIGAFHARFDLLDDLIAGENASQTSIRSFVLNFNDESTGVKDIPQSSIDNSTIWDLSGRNVGTDKNVLRPGIYVRGGKKIWIK
ncbi:MAG: hypothetical protein IKP43_10250, partial [Bacteroidaceae bacterium]|nr:hypothetical protein [Bacteroidaceae bacterium]